MWERVKVDMMRANGLKKQSDELEKQLSQMKARIGGDWKSRFNLTVGLISHFLRSSVYIASFITSPFRCSFSQAIPCFRNSVHRLVQIPLLNFSRL